MGGVLKLLLEHREAITKIADLAAKIARSDNLSEQVTLAIELLRVAATVSPTDYDDQVVQFLETVSGTELFALLVSLIEKKLAPEPIFGDEEAEQFGAIDPATLVLLIQAVLELWKILKELRK